jgi:translation initiation factor 2 subunit 1
MVNVTKVTEVAAYVTLLEYGNIEGMILSSELSRKRIRSMNKLIRVGRNEVVVVLRVDEEKGYIDLSKKQVNPDDVLLCEDRYMKAKTVHSIMNRCAQQFDNTIEEVYTRIGWPLYERYGHAHTAFKLQLSSEEHEDIYQGLDVSPEERAFLHEYTAKRLAPPPVKLRADVEVGCTRYEGVEAVRAALQAGMSVTDESSEEQVQIKLIAPPLYVFYLTTTNREQGIRLLEQAIERTREVILSKQGVIEVTHPPRAVTKSDETELRALMERLALENEEVDGDAAEDA